MIIVRPITINDAALTDANVLETVPTAYNAGTTYGSGTQVSVAGSANAYTVYESLAGSNTGNTPASSPAWWVAKGTVYGVYAGGTTYALADRVTDTTNHLIYESLQAGNTGHAVTDATWWVEVGASNKWAPFDGRTGDVCTWESEIVYEVTTTGIADTLGLMNMAGITDVNLVAVADAVEVLNEDYDLIAGVGSWWDWFFEPRQTSVDLAITDLIALAIPTGDSLVMTITMTGPTTMSIGEIVVGRGRNIGGTQYGLSAGIVDYSMIDEDDFGVRSILQRGFVKRMSTEVWVDAADTSFVFSLLANLRATPVLAIGSDVYQATAQYGLLKSWRERVAYVHHSILDLDVEGL